MLKSRALRLLAWALLALVLLAAVAWLALPPLLKWQLETQGSQRLGREVRVEEVRFAPWTLSLTLRGLSVGAAPGSAVATPQLQIERVFVDLDARSLLRLAPVVEAIEIDAPRLRLVRLADGRYDIDDLLHRLRQPAAPPQAEPARFALFNLRLSRGEISLDDRPMDRRHELRKISLGLPFLSNLPDDLQVWVEPRLAFVLNGSEFDSQGRATPFAQGRASEFRIRFDNLDLKPYWAYLPKGLPVQAQGGALWADLSLHFEQHEQTGPRVELQGQIDLRDMALKTADDAPLLAWQSLRMRLADVRPLQRQVSLDAVHVDGAVLYVRRDAAGRLELERLAAASGDRPGPAPVAAASVPASAAAGPPAAPGWQLQLGLLELNAAQVRWLDASVAPAAELQLHGIGLRLKQLRWPIEADAALVLDARLATAGAAMGSVHAEGTLTDRQAKITVQLSDIELAAAAPYLRQHLRPQPSARLSAAGEIDWASGAAPRQALALSSLRIDDFKLAHRVSTAKAPVGKLPATTLRASPAQGADLQWQRLELTELRADMLQRRVGIGSLNLQRPSIDLARDAAGVLSVSRWVVGGDAAASVSAHRGAGAATPVPVAAVAPAAVPMPAPMPAATGVDAATPWRIELRDFRLDGGRVRFADAALPAGPLELDGLRALAQGLAWPVAAGAAPMTTQLTARLSQPGARAGSAAKTTS
ncbi:MAG: DUF748 domain-containing protein, partial [Rubrivivax sp.]